MQAAERIFEGQFDDVQIEGSDVEMASVSDQRAAEVKKPSRLAVRPIYYTSRYVSANQYT
jgi:hypothetical protein